jgi:DNA/RNA endonuclease G (NUC1)
VWVSFTVSKRDWDTDNVLSRNFHTPKELQAVSLEEADYEASGYDMGHMYGLQFVSASEYAAEVNEVPVIAAQRPNLNRRVWLQGENRIKQASETKSVEVLTGQLWLTPMPPLLRADETHSVASHCYLIMNPGPSGTEEAYLVPQDCDPESSILSYALQPKKLREKISSQWLVPIN